MATKPPTPSSLGHPFQKIYKLSDSIMCAVCGLIADIDLLLSYARQEVLRYRLTRSTEIPVTKLVQRLADVSQEYTRHKTLRPLAASMTFAGYTDANGFQLLSLEVASVMHWKATAYGRDHLSLRRFLESGFAEGITSKKAAELAYEAFVKVSECFKRQCKIHRNGVP
ncbi:proteasome component y13 [Fusarium albosuccineum]|uniref:Proteasome component y13 n=1 Tax=Fusarium albosuccineum TaxID=1237068 RepID=A0A8H4LAM2_9HYPO|nr:proteasome component y13 [Fusarium albosuccineum]